MKQIYELGQVVWAFKQQGDDFVKTSGVIRMAEINTSGYVQYQIKCMSILPNGDKKDYTILANHASLASTEAEIDEKIKKYNDWAEAQKKDYESNFGAPEFDLAVIDNEIMVLAQERG